MRVAGAIPLRREDRRREPRGELGEAEAMKARGGPARRATSRARSSAAPREADTSSAPRAARAASQRRASRSRPADFDASMMTREWTDMKGRLRTPCRVSVTTAPRGCSSDFSMVHDGGSEPSREPPCEPPS